MPSKFKIPPGEEKNNDRPNRRKANLGKARVGHKFNTVRRKAFLDVVAGTGNLSEACRQVNINPRTYQYCRERDPEFADALELALMKGGAIIEAEMRRRGIEGVDEPVFQKGEQVGIVRRYSDVVLIKLAQGRFPEKYGSINGREGGGNIIVQINQAFEKLPDGTVVPVIEHQPPQIEDHYDERASDAP